MITQDEYLLTCLSEECAEIQQLCSKSIRFGLDSHHPADPEQVQNIQKLKLEINDFYAVIAWLEAHDLWDGDVKCTDLITKKIAKIDHFMAISRELGKLQ
jgi:hypothetical protein